MNSYLNICAPKWGNFGTTGCAFDVNQINGFIILPEGKTYTMSSYASDALFLTALKADALAAVKSARIYPYFHVIDSVDNTPANAVKTTAYGIHQKTELGKPTLMFTLAERGLNQIQSVFNFMGNNGLEMMLTDKRGYVWGQKNSSGLFKGAHVDIDPEFKTPVGTDPSSKMMNVRFSDEEIFLNRNKLEFYKFDEGTVLKDELSGVHDVALKLVSASASAIVIKVLRADNLKDLGLENEAALELEGAYSLVLASTGAAVPVSSRTYSATVGTITLAGTFTTALHYLSLTSPTALAALSPTPLGNGQTGGFESNVLYVTPA